METNCDATLAGSLDFEVPDGVELRRILIAQGMVTLDTAS